MNKDYLEELQKIEIKNLKEKAELLEEMNLPVYILVDINNYITNKIKHFMMQPIIKY